MDHSLHGSLLTMPDDKLKADGSQFKKRFINRNRGLLSLNSLSLRERVGVRETPSIQRKSVQAQDQAHRVSHDSRSG
jgi:hypothetical protein